MINILFFVIFLFVCGLRYFFFKFVKVILIFLFVVIGVVINVLIYIVLKYLEFVCVFINLVKLSVFCVLYFSFIFFGFNIIMCKLGCCGL